MAARILVVEDHPANLELVRYLLEKAGHTVLTAEDGAQGLEIARRERPDLVLSDLQMPMMDGYELLARLRADPLLRTVPVIAITAYSMSGDRHKVLLAGFNGYLAKPLVPETFVAHIEACLADGAREPDRE
jgi:CheY-like chemotaxis protein